MDANLHNNHMEPMIQSHNDLSQDLKRDILMLELIYLGLDFPYEREFQFLAQSIVIQDQQFNGEKMVKFLDLPKEYRWYRYYFFRGIWRHFYLIAIMTKYKAKNNS